MQANMLVLALLIGTCSASESTITRHDRAQPVQVVTFSTPYRITTNFARHNGEALVSTMPSDFEQKGFEPLVNLGMGRIWTGNYQEKISFVRKYLEKDENKDKIMIFADGEDVIMGGCDKHDLLERYHKIVKKSGAKIVFGAELWCFEPPNGKCPEPERAEWAKKEYGDKEFDAKLRTFQNEQSSADKTTSYINLNSGFFIGPASDLLEMMKYAEDAENWFRLHNGTDYYGDQRMYSQYWADHPDKVTLDYGAELVLTANGFKQDSLEVDGKGQVHNKMFGKKQCVIHGNGYAKAMVGDLQLKRAENKGEEAVALILKAHCLSMPESCSEGQKAVNKFREVGDKVKERLRGSLAEKDDELGLGAVREKAEEKLKLLKQADPAAFRQTMSQYVSANPIFLQLAEQLL